ncbi:MAG: hypothetical protein DRH56_10370 [Deltaproteobacteria bacterium]|nr:MAG: hypothetical protein DRH56_10370 [Deltaproteobacteria bacterium]
MAALAGGLVALVLGIIGISIWWTYFLKALAAGVPIMLILGGALAAYLGYEEIKDKRAADKFDNSDGLKDEVESLKEEIKELKQEKQKLGTEDGDSEKKEDE